jgi:two-component system sensor histidine kinase/response regulator
MTSLERLRALIVDHNTTSRNILVHQLRSLGMIPAHAESGPQALDMLRAASAEGRAYAVAILEVTIPQMSGFELARAVKSDPTIAATRLVLLPSFGRRGDGHLARDAGMDAYLTKPVGQSQLVACLTSVVALSVGSDATSAPYQTKPEMVTRFTLGLTRPVPPRVILVVEDNIASQRMAVAEIQRLGYRADVVKDGREALEALGRIRYDLVLMGCQTPETDGDVTTAEIRRREGVTRHTPIVAMTASALEEERRTSLAGGMDDQIAKPVTPEALARVLRRFL